jgi:ribokinase
MANSDQGAGTHAPKAEATPRRAIGLRSRVIVVGSVNVDLVATVGRLPAAGETVIGARFAQHHGGKGGNQAVAAARLGAATWFVGAVGADAFGGEARDALQADGVHVTELLTLPDQATGVALILVDAHGENSIVVAGGANAALTPAHVGAALDRLRPKTGDIVLVGHEIPTATSAEALRLAKGSGATTILNPAPATGVTTEILALTDIVTPNQGEAAVLVGHDGDPEVLGAELLGAIARGGHVLITLGRRGALLVGPGGSDLVAAPEVVGVDTVGAGDTLNGALAAGLAAGLDVESAARRAVTAATLAVTRAGAREGMPTAAELATALAVGVRD